MRAILRGFLITFSSLSLVEVDGLRAKVASGELHPKQAKMDLASCIVSDFHSEDDASRASEEFERRFARKELPEEVAEWIGRSPKNGQRLAAIMVASGLAKSSSAATRVISQGGVRVDGVRIENRFEEIALSRAPFVLQVGKRALRIHLNPED